MSETKVSDAFHWFRQYKEDSGKSLSSDSDEYGEDLKEMEYEEAREIAEHIKQKLEPFCDRIEIAGSVRREKPTVKDIEIVCIPKIITIQSSFFDTQLVKHAGFIETVDSWPKLKGDAESGKYMQRYLTGDDITLDIFTANKNNWGMIYAIRTGSAQFSHKVLASGWTKKGYRSTDGVLFSRPDKPVYIREEKDLFKLLGMAWVHPKKREV